MAKATASARVELVADIKTEGAQPGEIARPLEQDVEAWLGLGWKRVSETQPDAADSEKGK
jgi:hypothetical protein